MTYYLERRLMGIFLQYVISKKTKKKILFVGEPLWKKQDLNFWKAQDNLGFKKVLAPSKNSSISPIMCFCPHKKITPRTIRISGALIVICVYESLTGTFLVHPELFHLLKSVKKPLLLPLLSLHLVNDSGHQPSPSQAARSGGHRA